MKDFKLDTPELSAALGSHWYERLSIDSPTQVTWVSADRLLCAERFDLAAKTQLGQHYLRKQSPTAWSLELYREHLRVWSSKTFIEPDDSGKQGFDTYLQDFQQIFADLQEHGFNPKKSVVPISSQLVIHDGSHRTAAAIVLGQSIPTVQTLGDANRYDYQCFRRMGLKDEYLDAMALEMCRRVQNCYIAFLFPVEGRDDDKALSILDQFGSIFYVKDLQLTKRGIHNLTAQIYRGEHWLGTAANGFAGTELHVQQRFVPGETVRCVFLTTENVEAMVEAKANIRELYQNGNYPVHINDSQEEAIRLGRQILNKNSIHFFNHGDPCRFVNQYELLDDYRSALLESKAEIDDYMIDSSFVLSLYGIRKAQDLDYLHIDAELPKTNEAIQSHNSELQHYDQSLVDLLDNPRNYFFYDDIKFISLPALEAMKRKRSEPKDIHDLALLRGLNKKPTLLQLAASESRYFWQTMPHRLFRLRGKVFSLLPAKLRPLAKACYHRVFTRGSNKE